jgi:hypothetical protein
LRQAWA